MPSLYETISSDEEAVLKTIMQITSGITSIIDKVQSFLTYWWVDVARSVSVSLCDCA